MSPAQLCDRGWWQAQPEQWSVLVDADYQETFAALTRSHGEPDGPLTDAESRLWRRELEVKTGDFAVWDFDYYLLILWESEGGGACVRCETPGWGIAPGRS